MVGKEKTPSQIEKKEARKQRELNNSGENKLKTKKQAPKKEETTKKKKNFSYSFTMAV